MKDEKTHEHNCKCKGHHHDKQNAENQEVTQEENLSCEEKLAKLVEQTNILVEENKKLKDYYARTIADFDNYKKRVIREKDELRKWAVEDFILQLLPALDNLKLGLNASEDKSLADNASIIEGLKMVASQIKSTFDQNNVKAISRQGEIFDHNLEDCICYQPSSDFKPDTVIQVVKEGYTLNGKLIRPSTVIVAAASPENQEEKEDNNQEEQK